MGRILAVVITDGIGPVVTLAEAESSVTFDNEYPCAIRENTSAKTNIMMWQVLLRNASKVLVINQYAKTSSDGENSIFFCACQKHSQ